MTDYKYMVVIYFPVAALSSGMSFVIYKQGGPDPARGHDGTDCRLAPMLSEAPEFRVPGAPVPPG